jgi:hypothetical protein
MNNLEAEKAETAEGGKPLPASLLCPLALPLAAYSARSVESGL